VPVRPLTAGGGVAAAAEVGSGVKEIRLPKQQWGGRPKRAIGLPCLLGLIFAAALPASTYYVTIAGLGGEPDYEQRFTGWAKDIDKVLKSAPDAKVETLFGPAATRAAIRAAFDRIGKESKAQDAVVIMLIGHGTYDGADY